MTVVPVPAAELPRQHDSPDRPQPLVTSVVVCAYSDHRWEQLQRAVRSLRVQTAPAHQVIVVIDYNPPLLELATRELDATVVANERARGLSGARNTGVALADGDVIAFLDDDAHAEPDWLERLEEAYAAPDVLGVGGDVIAVLAGPRPDHLARAFDWVVGCSYEGLPRHRAVVRNMIGANMSLRRTVFDRVGGFQEDLGRVGVLPLGCEETELCIRAGRLWPGGCFVLEPSARVHHDVPVDRLTWSYFRRRCFAEGRSKAAVARLAGTERGLASERSYVRRTLPAAFATALRDALRERRAAGLVRAGAIVAGLLFTVAGYVSGAVRLQRTSRGAP